MKLNVFSYKLVLFKFWRVASLVCAIFWASPHAEARGTLVRGFNLIEDGEFVYDYDAGKVLPAQTAVDHAKRLGANHIILNFKALMRGPYSNEVVPLTPPAERNLERQRVSRLVRYIKSQGMTVGFRPIFFVTGPQGEFPWIEKLPNGESRVWWHGNIQPQDPDRWFESFRVYLDLYIPLAKILQVEEFTVGAELYSMTVGIEDQWKEYPYGFPGRWLALLRYVRSKLPGARLMYDINFTDDKVTMDGFDTTGGELERWRYRLVDLAQRKDPKEKAIWEDLKNFWLELDAVGLDVYRSLASHRDQLPTQYDSLVRLLRIRTDAFATQIDSILSEISLTLGYEKPAIFKELGFRSVEKGFIDPFAYAGSGKPMIEHQAAAYQAYFESFWRAGFGWFQGFNFWEISLDPKRAGPTDNGFSPVGKAKTEDVILQYFTN